MNRLIQSPLAADPEKQQPLPVASLLFLQDAYKDALNSTIRKMLGNYNSAKGYILYGCVGTGTDPGARTISAGAIFYNGEIYTVPAAAFATTGSDVAVGKITVTNPAPDPILLKDGTSTSVHNVRTIVFAAGATNSGDVNFNDLIAMAKITSIKTKNTQNFPNGGSRTDIATLTFTTPNDGITRKYLIRYKGSLVVGATTAGGATVYLMVDGADVDTDSCAINLGGGANFSYFNGSLNCLWMVDIAPNKVVKVQGVSVISNVDILNSVLTITEL